MDKKVIIGYTTGVFDMFHIGHLNILKKAKACCDYLIVGISTDELVEHDKNKRPIIPFKDRCEIVKAIRYVDEVDIRLSVPDMNVCRCVKMPPLLLIVLIENAFKHGISYSKRSYIFVDIDVVDDELICVVTNSKHKTYSTEHSGIGMSNITKRLDLLYGNNYTLNIYDESDDQYRVKLVIPILK